MHQRCQAKASSPRVVILALLIVLCSVALPSLHIHSVAKSELINERHVVYLPLLLQGSPSVPQAILPPSCSLNDEEKALETLFLSDPNQKRQTVRCDLTLSAVARGRAQDMAERDYFGHINPDGIGPNYLVRQEGYPLPSYYSRALDGNNIESIGAGFVEAAELWEKWKGSPGHREHVLGLQNFYRTQIEYGIGYATDDASTYRRYWVLITAKREP
ncbi:MAG: hypothetical protein HC802_19890 [Caldilineaceae bacterium]|nr:hypothetical protein [Caldilineaceae bacterium]